MKKFIAVLCALSSSAQFATAQVEVTSPSPTATPATKTGATSEAARIIVTGGQIEQSSTDTAQAITVLNDAQLKERAAASLGDTLDTQPGVAASGFAPGASRPVIRGWPTTASAS